VVCTVYQQIDLHYAAQKSPQGQGDPIACALWQTPWPSTCQYYERLCCNSCNSGAVEMKIRCWCQRHATNQVLGCCVQSDNHLVSAVSKTTCCCAWLGPAGAAFRCWT
jgi:hypothetical protein